MPASKPRPKAEDEGVAEHYRGGGEIDRLDRPRGRLEWERTQELALRYLPPPPAVVADIGGGPGRYALWLAGLGYRVEHRDLMAEHVQQLTKALDGPAQTLVATAQADARDLADLPDASVDAVLLLGPLYHLRRRPDRLQALAEAARIAKPGGVVLAAAISRWSARLDAYIGQKLYEAFPETAASLPSIERTGWIPRLMPGGFTAYAHRPRQLWAEVRSAGLIPEVLVGVEGVGYLLADLEERLESPTHRQMLLDSARALEAVPELLGVSPHLLVVARTPA